MNGRLRKRWRMTLAVVGLGVAALVLPSTATAASGGPGAVTQQRVSSKSAYSAAVAASGRAARPIVQTRLPPGCSFKAKGGTPYRSGTQIRSGISWSLTGCTQKWTIRRTPSIAFANYNPYSNGPTTSYTTPVTSASSNIGMPCRTGTWRGTLSISFDGNPYYFAFYGGDALEVRSC